VVLGSVNVLFGVFVGVQAGYLFGGAAFLHAHTDLTKARRLVRWHRARRLKPLAERAGQRKTSRKKERAAS
jgi:hypothetical protein